MEHFIPSIGKAFDGRRALALDHVLHVFGGRSGDKVCGVTASAVVTEMLDLEAFGYWFDPQGVCDAMHDRPVT
jgi:hypothetical protein